MLSTDQLGNKIEFSFPPKRIVSLVPSQTEFLFDIGLDAEIVGVTRYCIHPEEKVKGKIKIGGTKRFDIEKIKALEADLVIGNKEENYLEGISQLKALFPVWVSDIYTLKDAWFMMRELGRICDRPAQGEKIVQKIQQSFSELGNEILSSNGRPLTVAYFIWRRPYMVAASNTFIDYMLYVFGLRNVFSYMQRYPEIEPGSLEALKPDFIFLSSEPYRFSEKHIEEFRVFCPSAKVVLADGEMFSWYGSRLKFAAEYFIRLRKGILG